MALRTRLLLIVGLVMTAMLLLAGYVGHSAGERMRAALLQARAAHLLNTFRAHAEYRLACNCCSNAPDPYPPPHAPRTQSKRAPRGNFLSTTPNPSSAIVGHSPPRHNNAVGGSAGIVIIHHRAVLWLIPLRVAHV